MKGQDLIVREETVSALNRWKRDINSNAYRPFLTVRKVNKVGRRHWLYCPIQQREVHLLSDGERRAYTILLNMAGNVAVMEQYALDVDETVEIAEELGFIHPRNHVTNEAYVMTTDFVTQQLNASDGRLQSIVYTFKYFDQIYVDELRTPKPKSYRTWQKFSIEKLYWNRRGVEYRVITEKDATKERFWNIQFCANTQVSNPSANIIADFINALTETWCSNPSFNLLTLCKLTSLRIIKTEKHVVELFKYCVIHQLIQIDNQQCLRNFRPIELISQDPVALGYEY
jgi:hypothetical protein